MGTDQQRTIILSFVTMPIAAMIASFAMATEMQEPGANSDSIAAVTALEKRLAELPNLPDTPKHPDRVLAFYCNVKNMSLMDVTEPPLSLGPAETRNRVKEMYSTYGGHVEFLQMQVTAGTDVAFVASMQRFTGKDVNNGKEFDLIERVTDGLRKVNGKWCIAHQHLSLPLGEEAFKAALLQKSVNPNQK